MKRILYCPAIFLLLVASLPGPPRAAEDAPPPLREQEGNTVSIALRFTRKKQNPLQRAFSLLDYGPNGYATGFVVGDGLVMTAYHVVSGNLSVSKKVALGFGLKDELAVEASVDGCEVTVLRVDEGADLALLRVCRTRRQAKAPAFQSDLAPDERVVVIARPHGEKMVRRGVYSGPYMLRDQQYWAAKLDGRDGYSGSPVYNHRAEIIGVYSGYDWSQKVAIISPGERARKLLEEYNARPQQ